MAKKKIAGKERPYTFREFLRLIEDMAKSQDVPYLDQLDYFLADAYMKYPKENEILDYDFQMVSRTHFGGSEGIYTTFLIERYPKDVQFATAKTLGETDEDYIGMCAMAARICLIANTYVKKHTDEFDWTGFNVDFEKDGRPYGGYICGKIEQAEELAARMKKDEPSVKVTIRDNATRKVKEYK